MRIRPLVLLAALPIAAPAAARGIVVEPARIVPGATVAVSWEVPPDCEESELLIEVEGGPRVRLTDERRERSPRVVVRIPALAGTARLLVRGGGEGPEGRHRETDLLVSERFVLAPGPRTLAAPPVPAASTRPDAGPAWEWWEAGAVRTGPAPEPALRGAAPPRLEEDSASPEGLLTSPRDDSPPRFPDGGTTLEPAPDPAAAAAAGPLRVRGFAGAPVPLRN